MVKLVNHLCLIHRQKFGSLSRGTCSNDFSFRHIKHPSDAKAQWIDFWRSTAGVFALAHPFGLADKHRHLVELFGQLRIALAAEHRAGARVGVNQAEFVGREGEAPARVGGLCHLGGKADKFGGLGSTQRHQAEFDAAVDGGEDAFTVLKI
ncbi:MAG: hypothetical protein R3E52_13525 [Burkholderiaceae bacterium]